MLVGATVRHQVKIVALRLSEDSYYWGAGTER